MPEPGYLTLHRRGELIERAEKLERLLSPCRLCPWECGAERTSNRPGRCRSTNQLKVSSTNLHFGEEPPISGQRGSGTIFLTNCTLRCLFCQNYPISQMGNGVEMGVQE
ncbi:MAG TPA: radical SAM protein, partial [Candidatus Aminicenantes bacterium]|nr:radical SAM protein [Candidatus Aminicenantes bacterium]